jgi:uncharacterized protein (TIGR02466 family)
MSKQLIPLFPIPVCVINQPPTDELASFLLNSEVHPIFESNPVMKGNGTYTKNRQILKTDECKDLRNFILSNAKDFVNDVMGYQVSGLVDVLSWVSYKKQDENHAPHNHPNSFISGVYYYTDVPIETPLIFGKKVGALMTYELLLHKDPKHANEFSSDHYVFRPKKGDILLFPSFVTHFVPPNPHPEVRTSLSFNLMPETGWGDNVQLTQFNYIDALDK